MSSIDGDRVRRAIDDAERGTTGRIGVRLTHERIGDAGEIVRRDFHHAGLHEHPDANAVLFLIAPKSRRFAVHGGDGIHARVGDAFWEELVKGMEPFFRDNRLTDGLVFGIERVGQQLREHFRSEVTA
jgi:uncharacterized membrane protein